LRELKNEESVLNQFASSLNTHVVGFIPYSEKIKECSGKGVTLFQLYPDSPECDAFRTLAENIWNNELYSVPTSMKFEDLHAWWTKAKEA
jgi:nitrogenase subunit NifH